MSNLDDSLPTNGDNDILEPTPPDTQTDNERMEAESEAAAAEQQQQPVLDNALPANDIPSVDDGEEFYLDKTSRSWITAQEQLDLVLRGPEAMVNKEEKPGPILNMDYIRSTMDLPREVLNGYVRDADTVLTDDPFIKEKLPVADDPDLYKLSLGHKDINCTPRQLAK